MKKKRLKRKNTSINNSKKQKNLRNPWLVWGKLILIGIIGGIGAFYLIEYLIEPMKREVFAYYYVLNTIPIEKVRAEINTSNELRDMFSIVIKPDHPLNIQEIKIHHISEFNSFKVYCSENDINKDLTQKIKETFNSKVGTLRFNNIPTLPEQSKFIINVIGVVDSEKCNPVIVKENNQIIWPVESKLVAESYLFLARYWQIVLTLNILCILSIYYFIKIRG